MLDPVTFCSMVLAGLLIGFRKQLKELLDRIDGQLGGPPGQGPLPFTDARLLFQRPQ